MKRKLFWTLLVLIFIALAASTTLLRNRLGPIPHFAAGAPASIPHVKFAEYEWMADAPFENDRLWCWAATSTGLHAYLYDLKNRAFLGELFDGSNTGICSRDGSRLLIRNSEPTISFEQEVSAIVGKLLGRRVSASSARVEIYWVLDTSRNVATRIGQFSQLPGSGSSWHSSPDFRRGYTMPTTGSGKVLFVCDLENVGMTPYAVNGYPEGWWDDRRILIQTPQHQFELFDIQSEATTQLFNPAEMQAVLSQAGLTNSLADLSAFPSWNGTNYDFYFGSGDRIRGLKGNSFLLKANRSGPSLSLISTNFGFCWGGSFNATGGLYLFQGEKGAPGSAGDGSVHVRNLTNGTETTIVPPDNKGQYAIPRFYGNEVIYFRNRVLHLIELSSSNDSVIFPEVEK